MERGWLQGKLVQDQISAEVLRAADEEKSTKPSIASPDVKLLRGPQQNAAVMTVLTLQNQNHKRVLVGLTRIAAPLKVWQGEGAKETRSGTGNTYWLIKQFEGGHRDLLINILRVMYTPDFCADAGFLAFQAQAATEQDFKFEEDEAMTSLFGKLSLSLVSNRIRRTYYAFNA